MQKWLSLRKHAVSLATWHPADRETHGVGGRVTLSGAGPVSEEHLSPPKWGDRIPGTEKPIEAPTGTNVHPRPRFLFVKIVC